MRPVRLNISIPNARALVCATGLLQVGCLGTLGIDGGSDGEAGAGPGIKAADDSASLPDLDELDCEDAVVDPGRSLIRLLSRKEYLNTLADLIGTVPDVEQVLAAYVPPSSLGVPQAPVGATDVEGFYRAAEVLAAHITSDPVLLGDLAPCLPEEAPLVCAQTFVETFGGRAYRAPLLDQADIDRHLAVFSVGVETSYARGIELVTQAILQSPRFLYQLEIGTSDAVSATAVDMKPYELAARLSYTLWDRMPDQTLLDAALAGELSNEAGLLAQADRMLADERGQHFLRHFLEEWSHLGRVLTVVKDSELYPAWPTLRDATHAQALAFFDHVLSTEGGTLSALLTSPTVMLNDTLAPHYGVTAGAAFEPFVVPVGEPSGVLTLPSVMASFAKADQSSPIFRGVFVREALFCETPPAPPAEIPPAPEVDSGGSTRDRLNQHVVDPACAGCHKLIDPVGLGLEHYDAIGLYRSDDGGKPVDASGELIGTDVDGKFTGAVELGSRLAESEAVEQCVSRQWFRYATSRVEDDDTDLCMIKKLVAEFREGGQSLHSLPHAIILSDAFRYRRPSDAEVTP